MQIFSNFHRKSSKFAEISYFDSSYITDKSEKSRCFFDIAEFFDDFADDNSVAFIVSVPTDTRYFVDIYWQSSVLGDSLLSTVKGNRMGRRGRKAAKLVVRIELI